LLLKNSESLLMHSAGKWEASGYAAYQYNAKLHGKCDSCEIMN